MRTATRSHEVRVWNETADLLGLWEIQRDGRQYVVTHDHREETRFDDEGDALLFARLGAEALVETSRRDCPCGGTDPECGFWEPHGISIQEVEADLALITPPLLCL